jgi:hypothetical protein
MGRRYALRDDPWDAVKGLLPGREDTVGLLREITGFLSRQRCIDIAQVFPGEICRNGLAIGRMCIGALAGGRKAVSWRRCLPIWPAMLTTSTP